MVNRLTNFLVDGHDRVNDALARQEATGIPHPVPVCYVELEDWEEDLILALYDHTTTMAVIDRPLMMDLLDRARTLRVDTRLQTVLEQMRKQVANRGSLDADGHGDKSKAVKVIALKVTEDQHRWLQNALRDIRSMIGSGSDTDTILECVRMTRTGLTGKD
jgi:hypothetical protein